jgi:hypothetical protein
VESHIHVGEVMVGGVDCRYITAYAQVIMMKQTWLLGSQGSAALLPHR